jgi:hypothetical protein
MGHVLHTRFGYQFSPMADLMFRFEKMTYEVIVD